MLKKIEKKIYIKSNLNLILLKNIFIKSNIYMLKRYFFEIGFLKNK